VYNADCVIRKQYNESLYQWRLAGRASAKSAVKTSSAEKYQLQRRKANQRSERRKRRSKAKTAAGEMKSPAAKAVGENSEKLTRKYRWRHRGWRISVMAESNVKTGRKSRLAYDRRRRDKSAVQSG